MRMIVEDFRSERCKNGSGIERLSSSRMHAFEGIPHARRRFWTRPERDAHSAKIRNFRGRQGSVIETIKTARDRPSHSVLKNIDTLSLAVHPARQIRQVETASDAHPCKIPIPRSTASWSLYAGLAWLGRLDHGKKVVDIRHSRKAEMIGSGVQARGRTADSPCVQVGVGGCSRGCVSSELGLVFKCEDEQIRHIVPPAVGISQSYRKFHPKRCCVAHEGCAGLTRGGSSLSGLLELFSAWNFAKIGGRSPVFSVE